MPFAFYHDESQSNPARDARDAVVVRIDKISRGLETAVHEETSSTQLVSRLDDISASLPQLRTDLGGLRRLQSVLEDADQKLSRLWELTPVQRYVKREFVRSVLEELSLGVDDTLISVLHAQELHELAQVEREQNLDDVAQIFLPHWPAPPRAPSEASLKEPDRSVPGGRSWAAANDTEKNEADPSRTISALLQAVLQRAQSGAALFTVEELCDKIRSAPELSNIPIGDLYRREIPTGFQHEFIVIKSAPIADRSVWIRVDRAAKGYRRWQIKAKYPANDTARLGDGDYQLLGSSRLRAHVTFSQKSTGPKFLTLADLVTIMHEESRDYRLLSENCYFFTSVIQELLTDQFGGKLVSGALGHRNLGTKVRQRVRRRFTETEPEPHSQTVTHESPIQVPSSSAGPKTPWNIARSLPKVIKLFGKSGF